MTEHERGITLLFPQESEASDKPEPPYGFEEGALFDVEAFRAANPEIKNLLYNGPSEHESFRGTAKPTHMLQVWFDADYSHGITVNDFRGRTGDTGVEFRWQGRIAEMGFVRLDLNYDPQSTRKLLGVKDNLPDELRPENILGTDRGLSIAVMIKGFANNRPVSYPVYSETQAKVLQVFMRDMKRLDFSGTPFPRVQNLTGRELKERGIEVPKK
jgi:hypothetical protein